MKKKNEKKKPLFNKKEVKYNKKLRELNNFIILS